MPGVNGGFGLMMQMPQEVLQQALNAFLQVQSSLFSRQVTGQLLAADYGISYNLSLSVSLPVAQITLIPDRTFSLNFTVSAVAHCEIDLAKLPGGTVVPAPLPTLDLSLSGSVEVAVAGKPVDIGGQRFMGIDLTELMVTNFQISVDNASVTLSQNALNVLSAIIRRCAIMILAKQVGSIPMSWQFTPVIPILGSLPLQGIFDYKIVSRSGTNVLALLVQIRGENTDWPGVAYALDQPSDVGIYVDLDLINYLLGLLGAGLEGQKVDPSASGIVGDAIFHDVRLHVTPGQFVLDNATVVSRTMQTIEKDVEKVICTALDPCNLVCSKVIEKIYQIIELDEYASASGYCVPYIAGTVFRVNAQNIHVSLGIVLEAFLFTAGDAFLPLGAVVTPILMVIGNMFLDRVVTNIIDDQGQINEVVNKPIPGTNLTVKAAPRTVTWPVRTFAVMTTVQLVAV